MILPVSIVMFDCGGGVGGGGGGSKI